MIMAKKELCLNSNYFDHILVLLYFIPITWFDENLLYAKNQKVDCFKIKQNTKKYYTVKTVPKRYVFRCIETFHKIIHT